MRRRLGLSLGALGAGVVLLVSGAFASPQDESAGGGTLRLMWGAEPISVDSALATNYVGSWILLNATCAKLFTIVKDPATGRPRVVPEVVWRESLSNDRRTYTLDLKRTFRFDNGARVTAQSFADAFNRNADPRMGSPARPFMRVIAGAEAAMRGPAKKISGVQVLGRYRLRIRLKSPSGDFRARLTMPYFCPIWPGTPIDPKGIDEPHGSGPYYINERVPGRRVVLERNPYYRGGRTANPDRIVWTIESDPIERLEATERGENDFTVLGFGHSDAIIRALVETYGVNRPGGQLLRSTESLSNYLFLFNQDRHAFKGVGQVALRKAINYAIDRPALIRAHAYLTVRRSDRLLPAALSESRRLYPLDGADLVTARKWRARAGHVPETLTLYTTTLPFSAPSAQEFVVNMRQLGIEVDYQPFDLLELFAKLDVRGEPWDVALFPVESTYPDPAGAFISLLHGTRYEALIDAANRLTGAIRAKAWADLETDLMLNDPPVAAYADSTSLFFVSRSFGCWRLGYGADLGAVCKKVAD
jgi:ABC-type oligopeptide transport system substrate-binding subunit